MGRSAYYAGNRNFDPWNLTIINDEDFKIRNALESWSNSINSIEGNTRKFQSGDDTEYKTVGSVHQYSKTNEIIRVYKFYGLWIQDLAPIDLDWSNDSIQEYSATFRYDEYKVDGGTTGNAGGA